MLFFAVSLCLVAGESSLTPLPSIRWVALQSILRVAVSANTQTQTNEQTERAIKIIEDVLRHFVSPRMLDWDKHLCMAQFGMNSAWHETVQETTFFFLKHGRSPKTPLDNVIPHRPVLDNPTSSTCADWLQQTVAKAMKFTLAAQQRHKRYHDAKHVPAVFAVNDQVLLSTSGLNLKLAGTGQVVAYICGTTESA